VKNKFNFNELFKNSIPISPKLDIAYSSSIRKRLRYTLNHLHEEWTETEVDESLEYFYYRLLAETKDFNRTNSKNTEIKFTVFDEAALNKLQKQLAAKSPYFRDMELETLGKARIYRKLPDINNLENTYTMRDVNWLNFSEFIFSLVHNSQKPLVLYRGIFDMMYVGLLVLSLLLQKAPSYFRSFLQRHFAGFSKRIRYQVDDCPHKNLQARRDTFQCRKPFCIS